MMRLHPDDIQALATAIAREITRIDGVKMDEDYLSTQSIAERKRLAREEMKRQDAELKKIVRRSYVRN